MILDPVEWFQKQVDWWCSMPERLQYWIRLAFILNMALLALVELTSWRQF